MDEKAFQQIMEQFALLNGRLDRIEERMDRLEHRMDQLEQQVSEDRKALMETLSTIDRRLDRLEQGFEEVISRSNDMWVRHRHLVHKVAELEQEVAVSKAK